MPPNRAPAAAFIALAGQLRRQGRLKEAAAALTEATRLDPANPVTHANLGLLLSQHGQHQAAITAYRAAIALRPDFAEAWSNLGNALAETGALPEAITCLEKAATLKPGLSPAQLSLGRLYLRTNRLEPGIDALRRTIAVTPDDAGAWADLGNALHLAGRPHEALDAFRQALQCNPRLAEIHANMVHPLAALGRHEDAIAELMTCLRLKPDFADAHLGLGNMLVALDRLEQAIAPYRHAIRLKPAYLEAHLNLGNLFYRLGQFDSAQTAFRQAIQVAPDQPEAHFNHAVVLLRQGRFRDGWAEMEWRLKMPTRRLPRFRQPMWQGEPLAGKTLLLLAEQGAGDTIQFCRYAPMFAGMGAHVILLVPHHLRRLLATLPAAVITDTEERPEFDYYLPIMSAPHRLDTTLETIPAGIPYLHAEPAAKAAWRDRLAALPGRKIGLTPAGDPRLGSDARRSIPPSHLAPLAAIPGVTLISLQKGQTAPTDFAIADFMAEITDFADTAALIDALDLVITVDTAVAHLAGALGKPVWILSRFDADWRWLTARDTSPWYPTARILTQARRGDWDDVVARVTAMLRDATTADPARPLLC